jgi:N utilization substance protein B
LQVLVANTNHLNQDPEESFVYIQKEFAPELKDSEFARKLFFGILADRELIDEELQKLAPRWPIDKLSSIERCILEIGAYELLFMPQTPKAVILNETVELAKEFGDDTAGSFINGVLSSLAKSINPGINAEN